MTKIPAELIISQDPDYDGSDLQLIPDQIQPNPQSNLVLFESEPYNITQIEGPGHRKAVAGQAKATLESREQAEQHHKVTKKIMEVATTDELTGLRNKMALGTALPEYIKRSVADGTTYFLAFIDLNHLNQVNNQAGHIAGDEYLKVAASAIKKSKRQSDDAFRIGGDEFVVIYADNEDEDPIELQDVLRQRILDEINLAVHDSLALSRATKTYALTLGASAGLTQWDPRLQEFEAAKDIADKQMYTHKRTMHAERN